MAVLLYSGVISNGESILLHNKSRNCRERYRWSSANLNGKLMVRMGSDKWNFRYFKLLKSPKFFEVLGPRYSNVFSLGLAKPPLGCGLSTIIAEVTS